MPVDTTKFRSMAPGIMQRLIADFELTDFQSAGILGNIGTECMGFHAMHELGQPDGKGGYGWGQWTGPRRQQFFDWCDNNGLDWESDDANYGFMAHELKTSECGAISALLKTTALDAAVVAFERNYERAGVPNYDSRESWGKIALDAYQSIA